MNIHRNSILWCLLVIASFGGIALTKKYFSQAFPIIHLSITMDRAQAQAQAANIAHNLSIGPKDYHQAISFSRDETTKLFVELEAGGLPTFNAMMQNNYYTPYTWVVRHFQEHEAHEVSFVFTPDGKPYGFKEKISETVTGAALKPQKAQQLAEKTASSAWNVNFTNYTLVESSQDEKNNKRIDHTFVYQRTDASIGQGLYRLELTVSGDKLTGLSHFVKVPQEFLLRYQEMRSANNSIAIGSTFLMMILYILGCCLIGFIVLSRQHWLLWRQPLLWGIIISFLQILSSINQLPLAWMLYNTALGINQFIMAFGVQLIIGFIAMAFGYTFIFMLAESLTRKAFGSHPQFWRLWSCHNANSWQVLGRTLGGYLVVGIDLAIVVITYLIATTYLGWWTPADNLVDPNILATYVPWLNAITLSLNAGFVEECLFRAIPLASAALLGQRFGGKKYWIACALILQALIFGAAHANYPAQPSYARVIELIIPSLIFGGLYLIYGLLPAILSHVTFDIVWFALPLFVSQAPGAWINQLMVILLTFIPLFIVLIARVRNKKWQELDDKSYNATWQPETTATKEISPNFIPTNTRQVSPKLMQSLGIFGAIGCLSLFFNLNLDDLPLTISRTQAITVAREHLLKNNINLPATWQALPVLVQTYVTLQGMEDQHLYVWQNVGPKTYRHLIGNYLMPAVWIVRFIKFEGSTCERAEEYQVFIANNGTVLRTIHTIPEALAGAHLHESDARNLAHLELKKTFNLDAHVLQEISAKSSKLPERTDWDFVFYNPLEQELSGMGSHEGQTRIAIHIAGNQITDSFRFVKVPEQWQREQQQKETARGLLKSVTVLLLVLILLALSFTQPTHSFSLRSVIILVGIIFAAQLLASLNTWPSIIAQFNSCEPFMHQLLTRLGGLFVMTLIYSVLLGFMLAMVTYNTKAIAIYLPHAELNHFSYYAIGLCITGSLLLLKWVSPNAEPTWGSYSSLGSYLPFITTMLSIISKYLWSTTIALYAWCGISSLITRYTWGTRASFVLCLLGSLAIPFKAELDSIPLWFIYGITTGLIIWLLYYYKLRFEPQLIPYTIALPIIAHSILTNLALLRHGGLVEQGFVLSCILLILLARFWSNRLQNQ